MSAIIPFGKLTEIEFDDHLEPRLLCGSALKLPYVRVVPTPAPSDSTVLTAAQVYTVRANVRAWQAAGPGGGQRLWRF